MATNRLPASSRNRHDISTINPEIEVRPQAACGSTLTFGKEKMERQYVGFWMRVIAVLIDEVILILVFWPILFWIYGPEYLESGILAGFWDFILSYIGPFVVIVGFWNAFSATPGKLAIHARIVDSATGHRPSLRQWIIRYLCYFLSAIPLCLGFAWVAFDRRKRGWHDRIANTVVVYTKHGAEQVEDAKPDNAPS